MLRLQLVLYRRSDLAWEAFQQALDEISRSAFAQVPGVQRSVHGYRLRDPAGRAGHCDALVELWFDSPESLRHGLASAAWQVAHSALLNVLNGHRFRLLVREDYQGSAAQAIGPEYAR